MSVLAHIAGVPVEETLLSAGPLLAVAGSVAIAQLRIRRRRRAPPPERGGTPRQAQPRRSPARDGAEPQP